MTTYKNSGVNVELGNDASRVLFEAAKQTWKNREGKFGEIVSPFDDFSGVRGFDVSGLPTGSFMSFGFDGIGTKVEIAERLAKHDTVAHDLFAMACDDAVIRGAEPFVIGSVLDVKSLGNNKESNIDLLKQLGRGYVNAAGEAGVAVINGEIAEIGARVSGYGSFNYNWSAGIIWIAKKERMLTGKEVKVGDSLVGLWEPGFRSNGFSLIRKVLEDKVGPDWHEDTELAEMILTPSRIYTKALLDMFGGYEGEPQAKITGAAHITGGGIPEKLGRMLKPSGLGARISEPIEPSTIVRYLQDIGEISDEEAYKTWNMGQGMIVSTPEPNSVIQVAQSHEIKARVIGEVTHIPGIVITSRGLNKPGQLLKF
ncbi:MAG: AIR synthase-related protein [bacterium]|nr:AIR synthase-related protein [bacterium]